MKKIYPVFLLCLVLAVSLCGTAVSVPGRFGINTIIVEVYGFRNDKGDAYVGLYNSSDGFPTDPDKAYKSAFVPISNGSATIWFQGIPSGTYAVAVYHDENGNKKFDVNLFPFSIEGSGASNGATGTFGPPSFSDASFNLDKMVKKIQIKIKY